LGKAIEFCDLVTGLSSFFVSWVKGLNRIEFKTKYKVVGIDAEDFAVLAFDRVILKKSINLVDRFSFDMFANVPQYANILNFPTHATFALH
jgi:hypothetical protein